MVFTTHAHQRQLQPLAPRPPEHHRLPHVRSLCLQEQRQSPSASAAATHSIVFIITLLASSHATNIGMINIVDFVIAVTNVVAAACAVATRCYSSFVSWHTFCVSSTCSHSFMLLETRTIFRRSTDW